MSLSSATPPSSDLAAALAAKHRRLRDVIASYDSALVCFSGGVDSTLLLRVAHDVLGDRCTALTTVSITMAASEQKAARELAALIGVRLEVVESHELEREGFAQNPTDRCYHCKAELMDIARPSADRLGLKEVLLGTNLDDLGDHRPGLAAAKERGASLASGNSASAITATSPAWRSTPPTCPAPWNPASARPSSPSVAAWVSPSSRSTWPASPPAPSTN
jgi:PP-loop superfamily ATP-utilizing enzyme